VGFACSALSLHLKYSLLTPLQVQNKIMPFHFTLNCVALNTPSAFHICTNSQCKLSAQNWDHRHCSQKLPGPKLAVLQRAWATALSQSQRLTLLPCPGHIPAAQDLGQCWAATSPKTSPHQHALPLHLGCCCQRLSVLLCLGILRAHKLSTAVPPANNYPTTLFRGERSTAPPRPPPFPAAPSWAPPPCPHIGHCWADSKNEIQK
jgi:hypothetical protein